MFSVFECPKGVSRNELIVLVDEAARNAEVSDEDRERLLAAAKDERNTLFMCGLYHSRDLPNCKCPANHAGFVRGSEYWGSEYLAHDAAVENFPYQFDLLVARRLGVRLTPLEVVND